MDLKNPRQNPANFSHNHDCANLSTQKNVNKKKWLRIFGAGSLAFFMGVGTLCGVLIAPMGATSAYNSGDPAALAQSADSALTPQEQLLNGTWECNPETDPIIYTTESGIDIRWSMAGEYTGGNKYILESGVKFAGYAYITAGEVNWAIIGVTNENVNVNAISADWAFEGDNTPASNAVEGDVLKGKIISANTLSELFPNAVPSDELEAGEVLCFAQNSFSAKSSFHNSSALATNCYYNSILMSTMNDFYDKNLIDLPIVPKTLKTVWYGASDKTNGSNLTGTYKIFPLAGANANESFYVLNYLTSGSDAMKQSADWWLRSGSASASSSVHFVSGNAGGVSQYHGGFSYGVRPAFVLQLYSA